MPVVFRVVVKPTASIAKPQRSVDLDTMTSTEIVVTGRHDPCIVPRAVPVVENVAAMAILDLMLVGGSL
jgi:chorismate synthase